MRVCFVSRRFFPAISGMSIYAANLLAELVAAGHDVTMVSQYYGDARLTRVYGGGPPPPVPGVRVVGMEALGEQAGGDFEADVEAIAARIAALHAETPFDVIHAQYGYPTGFAALVASARTGVPNVVSIQGGDGHWVGSCCETHRLAMLRVLAHAGALLIGGPSFAGEVEDRLGVRPDWTFVPGAVDVATFTPVEPDALGGPEHGGAARILYHGRVDRRKGVLDFLHALKRLPGEWTATVSGIGPDLDAARELSAELRLDARVRFLGYVAYADAPDVYRAHDVFASPTYAEGFSNTILEAMASGHAVVSCRSVGVVDCLRHGENGLMGEAGDVDALVANLRRVVEDRAERERLGAAALAECRRTYSWGAVGRRIAEVYGAVRGTAPDRAFAAGLPITPCRFRDTPQLL